MRELTNKVAVVTGGASGIGFALARAFGLEEMKVMLVDIEGGALNSAIADLKKEGIDARGVECDVADRASVDRAAAETLSTFGKVHLLCANAGVNCNGAPVEQITPGDWEWVIGVDLMGTVHCVQAFLPHLKAQGEGGHILITSSVAGMGCAPGIGPHNVAKFGLVALAETLAAELAGTSIDVSVLCCGFARTRGADSARNRPPRYGLPTEASSGAEQLVAFHRTGMDPEEIATRVIHSIKENEFYIFTHPGYRPILEERFQRILAAYPKA